MTIAWTFDALGRLLQESSTAPSGSVQNYTDSYTYDLNSNRLTETIDQNNVGSTTDTITNTYNANNELTQAVDANTGTTVYAYDANGAQVTVTHTPTGSTTPDTTTTNEYDLQGQLAGSQTVTSLHPLWYNLVVQRIKWRTKMPVILTRKGQITIPRQIRDALELKPGSAVEFAVNQDGEVVLHRAATKRRRKPDRFEATRGKADIKWRTDDLMALLRSER